VGDLVRLGGAVLVLVLLVWALLSRPRLRYPATTATTDGRRPDLGPELTVSAAGDLKSIGAALDYVREHRQREWSWVIKVPGGQTYSEGIHIKDTAIAGFPSGVKIVSEGESPAVLRPEGIGPVIDLQGVEQFTVSGFVLDGGGRNEVVRLDGLMVGTRLENLEIRDIGGAGVAWDDIYGLANRPVQLANLTFIGRSPVATAIRMGEVRQLRIDGCRFIGPMSAAIAFSSSGLYADISIRHCRIHDTQVGVHFSNTEQDLQFVAVVNNTFHKVQRGLVWDTMPQSGSSSLTVQHNLFVGVTDTEAVVTGGYDVTRAAELLAPGSTLNNWTDRPAPTDAVTGLDLFAEGRRGIQAPSFASTDPANAGFLKPTSPSVADELKSSAQGADPIVGAIAP
jgi:hypothetical protein